MDIEALPAKVALAMALEARTKLAAERKLFTYYPETGDLRRELYAKHMAFFRLGATCPIRCFMAANRVGKCTTATTLIDTPDGEVMVKDLRTGDVVWAWDGEKKVAQSILEPFQKPGLHDCALVVMSDGRVLECADHHRILLSDGWRLLSECLPESFFGRPRSSSAYGLKAHASDDPRSIGTTQGCPGGCSVGCYQCDEQLHCAQDTGQAFPPSQGDAQQCTCQCAHSDDLEHKQSGSPSHDGSRLSIRDVLRRRVARFVGWLSQAAYMPYEPNPLKRRAGSLLRAVAGVGLRLMGAVAAQELRAGLLGIGPQDTPNVDGSHIIAVLPIGRHKVYDFTVPKYHNYCAAGLVNHNTEGGGGYEMVLHLTGRYPAWWEGSWFDAPVRAWVGGDTGKSVRDIVQEKLLGPYGHFGTGLLPAEDIVKWTPKSGVPQAVDTLTVKHYDKDGNYDGDSVITFKSYDQGREAFQGTEQDVIWLDEESNESIRSECILRLMTTDGLLIETFTPLRGLTPLVMQYMPKNGDGDSADIGSIEGGVYVSDGKAMVMAGWDDVPHLRPEQKKLMLANTPPYLRDARSKGIPSLGAGAIYPIEETEVTVADFPIPDHWTRLYGMDVGWNRTAVVWGAWDRDSDVIYLYAEHYRGQAEPSIHADAIKARGKIPGEIDPASRGRSQTDGAQLLQNYKDLGLTLGMANNGVESGLLEVWQRLSTGRLKIFRSLSNWRAEYRIYRRDEKGRIVKENDHIMDATRYLVNADPLRWKLKDADKRKVIRTAPRLPSDPGMGY